MAHLTLTAGLSPADLALAEVYVTLGHLTKAEEDRAVARIDDLLGRGANPAAAGREIAARLRSCC